MAKATSKATTKRAPAKRPRKAASIADSARDDLLLEAAERKPATNWLTSAKGLWLKHRVALIALLIGGVVAFALFKFLNSPSRIAAQHEKDVAPLHDSLARLNQIAERLRTDSAYMEGRLQAIEAAADSATAVSEAADAHTIEVTDRGTRTRTDWEYRTKKLIDETLQNPDVTDAVRTILADGARVKGYYRAKTIRQPHRTGD